MRVINRFVYYEMSRIFSCIQNSRFLGVGSWMKGEGLK